MAVCADVRWAGHLGAITVAFAQADFDPFIGLNHSKLIAKISCA
jgi:hypothetical protein